MTSEDNYVLAISHCLILTYKLRNYHCFLYQSCNAHKGQLRNYHRPLPGGLGLLSSCALEFWLSFRVPPCNTLGLRWCGHENQDIRWKWKATVSKLDIKNLGQFSVFIRYCCNLRGNSWTSTFPESSRSWFCIIFFCFFGRGGGKNLLFFFYVYKLFFFFPFQEDHCSSELILIIQTSQIKHRGYNTKKVHKSHAC